MLLVSGGEKGGTGKTAVATNLAACFAARGRDVLLVDADPQRSSAKWAEKRATLAKERPELGLREIPWVELKGDIFSALGNLRRRYGDIIVDVGGCDSVEFRSALAAADRLYSPMVPSDCDLETAGELNELVGQVRALGNHALEAFIVLNHVPTHSQSEEAAETIAALEEYPNLSLASAIVQHRKSFRQAYKMRIGVTEMAELDDRRYKALAVKSAAEIWALYLEVVGEKPAACDAAQ
jgi:chromosome partitioning protein